MRNSIEVYEEEIIFFEKLVERKAKKKRVLGLAYKYGLAAVDYSQTLSHHGSTREI
jgi:hypothetical protein